MKVIDLSQRTPAWHQWRIAGVTASEAPIIMGRSPYKTPWRLWAEKTGFVLPEDLSNNPNVLRGIRLEPQARRAFENAHNDFLLPLCAEADHNAIFRASFDGINDAAEPVELKCPCQSVFEDVQAHREQSEAYQLYWVQVQHQILVANSTRGWLVFYFEDQLIEFEIQRDALFLTELQETALQFWELVQTKKEPSKCPEQDCFVPKDEAQYRWTSLSRQYCSAHAEVVRLENHIKSLKEEMRDAQSKLVAMMGNYAHADYAGVKLSRYMMAGTVDYKQLATDKLGELDEQVLAAYRKAPQERLRISTNKPEQPVETPIKISLEQENLVLPGDSPSSFYF